MENMKEGRIKSLDVLKGVIILLIVLSHIVLSSDRDGGPSSLIIQTLYLGLMSFFMISGYFYRPQNGFLVNIKKRLVQLLVALVICIVVLTIAMFVWLTLLGYSPGLMDILQSFIWSPGGYLLLFESVNIPYHYPLTASCIGYYFLWAMMLAFIIFYALADRVIKDIRLSVITIISLLAVTVAICEFLPINLPLVAQLAPISAAMMFIGAVLSKYKVIEKIESFEFKNPRHWLGMVMTIVLLAVSVILFPPGTGFDLLYYGEYGGLSVFPYAVSSVLAFLSYSYLSMLVSRIPYLSDLLMMIGRHTLGILLLHGFFAKAIFATMHPLVTTSWFPPTATMTESLIVAAVVLVICIILCERFPSPLKSLYEKVQKR